MTGATRFAVPRAIFRKDLKLLWPLALASALLQGLLGVLRHRSSPFDFGTAHQAVDALVTLVLVVSMVLVIAITVQQDPPAGANQDWVTRPIPRGELLLAKLLAVALFVHGPILLVQLLQGLSEGFALARILPAALLANWEIALLFTLPVMAIAAMTRSIGEGVVASLAVLIGLILTFFLLLVVHDLATGSWGGLQPVKGTGVQWVWDSLSHLALLTAALAAIRVQYFRRRTLRARALFVVGLLVFMLAPALPWSPAFALQEWLGPHGRFEPITITFGAALQQSATRVPAPSGEFLHDHSHRPGVVEYGPGEEISKHLVRLVLPLRVAGLPAGSILHSDRIEVLLTARGGVVYRGTGRTFDLRAPKAGGEALLGQAIDIPEAVYRRWSVEPLRLRIDYSLTLLGSRTWGTLEVPGGDHLPRMGQCADRLNSDGKRLDVACMRVGAEPPCVSVALVSSAGGQGRETFRCNPDYEPAALQFSASPLQWFQIHVPLARAPGAGQLAPTVSNARLRFAVYQPRAHFSRRIVIAAVLLADWRLPPPRAVPPSLGKGPAGP